MSAGLCQQASSFHGGLYHRVRRIVKIKIGILWLNTASKGRDKTIIHVRVDDCRPPLLISTTSMKKKRKHSIRGRDDEARRQSLGNEKAFKVLFRVVSYTTKPTLYGDSADSSKEGIRQARW